MRLLIALIAALPATASFAEPEVWRLSELPTVAVSVQALRGDAHGMTISGTLDQIIELLRAEAAVVPRAIELDPTCIASNDCATAALEGVSARYWVEVLLSPRTDGVEVFIDLHELLPSSSRGLTRGRIGAQVSRIWPAGSNARDWISSVLSEAFSTRGLWGRRATLSLTELPPEATVSLTPGLPIGRVVRGGALSIEGVEAGRTTLRVEAADFEPFAQELTSGAGARTELAISLRPSSERATRQSLFWVGAGAGALGAAGLGVALLQSATSAGGTCITAAESCASRFVDFSGPGVSTSGGFSIVPLSLGLATVGIGTGIEALVRGEAEAGLWTWVGIVATGAAVAVATSAL